MDDPAGEGVTDGIVVVDGRMILDLAQLHRRHDVGDGEQDYDCLVCEENYPCELIELVDQLQEWVDARVAKAPVPDGTAEERSDGC